jgi:hypothetical protein
MSDRHFVSLDLDAEMLFDLRLSRQIFGYGVFDIRERFRAGLPLRVATGQVVTPDGKAFLGFNDGDAISHAHTILLFR